MKVAILMFGLVYNCATGMTFLLEIVLFITSAFYWNHKPRSRLWSLSKKTGSVRTTTSICTATSAILVRSVELVTTGSCLTSPLSSTCMGPITDRCYWQWWKKLTISSIPYHLFFSLLISTFLVIFRTSYFCKWRPKPPHWILAIIWKVASMNRRDSSICVSWIWNNNF